MDMETLGYFLYMNEMEQHQKEQQEEMMRDIFGDSNEDEENEWLPLTSWDCYHLACFFLAQTMWIWYNQIYLCKLINAGRWDEQRESEILCRTA